MSEGGEPTYGGKACLVDTLHVAIESQQKGHFLSEIFRLERQVSDEDAGDCHTNADLQLRSDVEERVFRCLLTH